MRNISTKTTIVTYYSSVDRLYQWFDIIFIDFLLRRVLVITRCKTRERSQDFSLKTICDTDGNLNRCELSLGWTTVKYDLPSSSLWAATVSSSISPWILGLSLPTILILAVAILLDGRQWWCGGGRRGGGGEGSECTLGSVGIGCCGGGFSHNTR